MVRGFNNWRASVRGETATAQMLLAVITLTAGLLWLGSQGINEVAGKGTVPDLVYLVAVPPVAAFLLALRYRAFFASDVIVRGQFSSVAWVFGGLCLLGFILTIGTPQGVVWAIGAATGAGAIWAIRQKRPDGRS